MREEKGNFLEGINFVSGRTSLRPSENDFPSLFNFDAGAAGRVAVSSTSSSSAFAIMFLYGLIPSGVASFCCCIMHGNVDVKMSDAAE